MVDLVVEDDPEMSWHDYFRAAKSSNDNRCDVVSLMMTCMCCIKLISVIVSVCVG